MTTARARADGGSPFIGGWEAVILAMGGDAVVGVGQTGTSEGRVVVGNSVSLVAHDGVARTVIRFPDGRCTP